MKQYIVYLEVTDKALREGGYLAHIPDLPGAVARGASKKEALIRLRHNLRSYLQSLANSGSAITPSPDEEIRLTVKEIDSDTLPTDYAPLFHLETQKLIEWIYITGDELTELLTSLPKEVWDWKPNPRASSIRELLEHMVCENGCLLQRLTIWPEDDMARLSAVREAVINRLSHMTAEERSQVTQYAGQDWSARKVIRKIIEQEREHLQYIRRLAERYYREQKEWEALHVQPK